MDFIREIRFQSPAEVPFEFLSEWFKDTLDYKRIHSEEEIKDFISLNPKIFWIGLKVQFD
jgi:hypothetical protein